jgi:hypothetical protein
LHDHSVLPIRRKDNMFFNRRTKGITLLVSLVVLLALALPSVLASELPNSLEWDGQGSDSEKCEKLGESDERTEDGWIHWIVTQASGVTEAELVLGGSGSGTYDPTKYGPTIEFFTPYFDVDTLEATLYYEGELGSNTQFVISDFCPGVFNEELTVSKTVVTSFTREHFWDIAKRVETEEGLEHDGFPKIWLYTDGSGDETATWYVDVTYLGPEDSGHNVSGTITIENTGTLDAVITAVDDVLGGVPISVNCAETLPYTLPVTGTLTCTYSEDGIFEGDNEVTVTTERDVYTATEPIVWGDPTTEINKTVNVKDISDLFGEVNLGTVTAPNGDKFTYDKHFAWEQYGQEGCGSFQYDNTATIVETGQEADATLKVNVQCLVFEGETAWAANGNVPLEIRYTPRGNWATYVEYAVKTTTLFAGQTIAVGTVSFSVPDGENNITILVTLADPWEFEDVAENLKVQDYESPPSGNPEPGLFEYKKTCDPASSSCDIVVPLNNYYGVHVNVGQWVPDPNFGP